MPSRNVDSIYPITGVTVGDVEDTVSFSSIETISMMILNPTVLAFPKKELPDTECAAR